MIFKAKNWKMVPSGMPMSEAKTAAAKMIGGY
jgi:hypothetical protein